MQIMLASWDTINTAQCIVGCSGGVYGDSLGVQGRGLWHVAAGGSMDVRPKLQLEANVGYAQVVKLRNNEDSWRDKDLGTEVNAGVSYNIAKGLDFGVYGAYMWLGGFVKAPPVAYGDFGDRFQGSLDLLRPGQLRVLGEAGTESSRTAPGGNPGGFSIFDGLTSRGGIPYI